MSTGSPDSLGFSLTPPLPGIINPDLALNAALAPVVPDPDADPIPLGRGWAFDWLAGEFRANGLSPAQVYDVDQLAMWIEKTVKTAKMTHPIYGDEYGMDDPTSLIGQPYTAELVGEYIDMITDALTTHDRIVDVTNFMFNQDPATEIMYAGFTVVLDDSDIDTVTVDAIAIGGV